MDGCSGTSGCRFAGVRGSVDQTRSSGGDGGGSAAPLATAAPAALLPEAREKSVLSTEGVAAGVWDGSVGSKKRVACTRVDDDGVDAAGRCLAHPVSVPWTHGRLPCHGACGRLILRDVLVRYPF